MFGHSKAGASDLRPRLLQSAPFKNPFAYERKKVEYSDRTTLKEEKIRSTLQDTRLWHSFPITEEERPYLTRGVRVPLSVTKHNNELIALAESYLSTVKVRDASRNKLIETLKSIFDDVVYFSSKESGFVQTEYRFNLPVREVKFLKVFLLLHRLIGTVYVKRSRLYKRNQCTLIITPNKEIFGE